MTSDAVPAPPLPSSGRSSSEPFDPIDVTWTPVSRKLIGARLTVTAIVLGPLLVLFVVAAAVAGEAWVWSLPALVLALTLWICWLVPRQVGAMAYAERADDLLVRHGIMFRSMVVVPYGRMQYVDVNAGPLARRFGIATVQLHTAAPATSAAINGLPPNEAARLRDRMASRGEARLAGL